MRKTSLQKVDAVVLASGIIDVPLFDGCRPGYKALLSIDGKPAVRYTLDALAASEAVSRICLVGPCNELNPIVETEPVFAGKCSVVAGGDTLLQSLRNGLSHYPQSSGVLVTTADMPLLTTKAIDDFLSACNDKPGAYEHSIHLSVVPATSFTGHYAAADKMFSRFRDSSVCQGNLGLVDPWILRDPQTAARVDRVYAARKGRFSSAMAFGWRVGLSYIFGVALAPVLDLQQFARIVSHRFGFGVVPVICDHPEIAVDIDEPADYDFVMDYLRAGRFDGAAVTEDETVLRFPQ